MLLKVTKNHILLACLIVWTGIFISQAEPITLVVEYGVFALLGVLGAIFANATGAGGGVVFVPFFNQLGLTAQTTVATSFAIQCCGMTAGALTWWVHYRNLRANASFAEKSNWQDVYKVLALTVPFSCIGIWLAQFGANGFVDEAEQLHFVFGLFSIALAIAIFATIPMMKKQLFISQLTALDAFMLPAIALGGGVVTAFLSIGVGELIAVYLIIRGFNVTFAIACAVILSAFSVWAGGVFHAIFTQAIYWSIVLFAGAGAIIGGVLAKYLVLYFSATNLKLFFAGWIFLLGISGMPV